MVYSFRNHASLGVLAISAALCNAQDFSVTVDTSNSSTSIDAATVIDASGFLIGDYDPDTNPEGTQTRVGLFGGSGNQEIDTITTLQTDTELSSQPTGSLALQVDALAGTAEMTGLTIDLLNGETGGTGLSVTIGFDTFRTFDPDFLYLGGIPITIPLGEVAQISVANLTQTAPATLLLSPADLPEAFEISGAIPAALDLTVTISLPGGEPNETPLEQVPVLLPINGQLEISGDNQLELSLNAAPDPISQIIPIEDVELPAIPFELPTIGEETAGVLFTLVPSQISIDAMISFDLSAQGEGPACAADLNGDGTLDFFDVSAFLNAFSSSDPLADLTGDGAFDFFDVSAFLNAYSAGCP